MFDITCSIVLYNHTALEIRPLVESFLSTRLRIKLFLVDNSDEDLLRYEFISPDIEYIFCGRNLGYGAGHNQAIQKSAGNSRYHLVMNPDISFEPGTLEGLSRFMDENRKVGLTMPKILYRHGGIQRHCKQLPSPFDLIARRFIPGPLKPFFQRSLDAYDMKSMDYDETMEIPNLCGCFMFIRTSVFEKTGGFDERYFMYLEDVDLTRRINQHFATVYYPGQEVIHTYDKGSYRNIRLLRYHIASSLRYFNKWGWFSDRERGMVNRHLIRPFRVASPITRTGHTGNITMISERKNTLLGPDLKHVIAKQLS